MEENVYHEMRAKEDKFWWHCGMRKIQEAFLDLYFDKNSKNEILDVGCGTGWMLKTLSGYGVVHGIDFSDIAVSHARSRGIGTVIKARVENLPFDSEKFDLVTCFDVLYHRSIENDESVLEEFVRVLKPGGTLLLREPSFQWLYGWHDRMVHTRRRYSRKELIHKIENSGFEIIRISYANFFLSPLVLINRWFMKKSKPKYYDGEEVFKDYSGLSSVFKSFLLLEANLIKYVNFPFGSSVVCLARKKP